MSYIRGRLYNRTKAREQAPSGQFVRKAETAETLAAKHGVDERTIRRDGKRAEALDKLATSPADPLQQAPAGPTASRAPRPLRLTPSRAESWQGASAANAGKGH